MTSGPLTLNTQKEERRIPVRIGLINVGVNSSHRTLRSPIFSDHTFEFVPIPDHQINGIPTYSRLNVSGVRSVSTFIPKRYLTMHMHNDPEFMSFTYGDYPETSGRAGNLKRLRIGDELLFLARLVRLSNGKWRDPSFYLVGTLKVSEVVRKKDLKEHPSKILDFKKNAHVRRWIVDPKLEPRNFWVFKGSPQSERFTHAVPFGRDIAQQVIRAPDRSPVKWSNYRTENMAIGSYTRSCRIFEDEQDIGILKDHVRRFR